MRKPTFIDLTGQRFGKLTVIGVDEDRSKRKGYFYCLCDCGTIKSCRSDSLKEGRIKSCGCLKKEQDRINLTANHSHKQSGTRLYGIWQGIKGRCNNPHNTCYDRYGGRGIKVCDEWQSDFSTFFEWALNNGYSEELTIDRIDNNGNYSPENCRWSDAETQCRNRRSNINITIGNSTRTLTEWCEIFKVDYQATRGRLQRNGFIGIDELFNADPEVTERPSVP